jgi:hypothetical protein
MFVLERGKKGSSTYVADAARASQQAVQHGLLAAKLGKSTIMDRIAALESALGRGQILGAGIRAAAKRRAA